MKTLKLIIHTVHRYLRRISPLWWGALLVIVGIALRDNLRQRKTRGRTTEDMALDILFLTYVFLVIIATFGTRLPDPSGAYMLTPFYAYKQWLRDGSLTDAIQILFNIALFIPLGLLAPRWFERLFEHVFRFPEFLIFAFLCSLSIELTQLITRIGCFELDDLFNNTLGAVLGFAAQFILRRVIQNVRKCKMEE